jgi:hypothetical protein
VRGQAESCDQARNHYPQKTPEMGWFVRGWWSRAGARGMADRATFNLGAVGSSPTGLTKILFVDWRLSQQPLPQG